MAILEVSNLKKIYTTRFGGNQVQALKNINFSVEEGEYVAIMGESGSGKTTLLNILAALDKPTAGEVLLNGKNLVSILDQCLSISKPYIGSMRQPRNTDKIRKALWMRILKHLNYKVCPKFRYSK